MKEKEKKKNTKVVDYNREKKPKKPKKEKYGFSDDCVKHLS
ncbi:MAG: hypothetical protein ACJAU8_000109 [Candidatus Paceibacteria bacterium]|jgi:hypothetical protein